MCLTFCKKGWADILMNLEFWSVRFCKMWRGKKATIFLPILASCKVQSPTFTLPQSDTLQVVFLTIRLHFSVRANQSAHITHETDTKS